MGIYEQAIFSERLRAREVPEWCEFLRLWAAFNCIYGDEAGGPERDRVMRSVRRNLSHTTAQELIDRTSSAALEIVKTPPGDMRRDRSDPQFREQTKRCASIYQDSTKSGTERLAGLMAVIYQVRCNLLHGDKDPDDSRDMRLVRSSNAILQQVLPGLENGIKTTASSVRCAPARDSG